MYQKVIVNGTMCMTTDGKRLGKVVSLSTGRVTLDNGITAIRGVVINDSLYHCCTKPECCHPCLNRSTPFCRYNQKYINSIGYYVKIDKRKKSRT